MNKGIIRRLTNLIALGVNIAALSACMPGEIVDFSLLVTNKSPTLQCESASYSLGHGTCVTLTNLCRVPGFPEGQWLPDDNFALYGLPDGVRLETNYPASLPPERRLCAGENAPPVANRRVDYLYSLGSHFGGGAFSDSALFVTVNETDLTLTATTSESVVSPGTTILLSAVISGGTVPYAFSWEPSAGLDGATGQFAIASPAVTTTYTVTVFDSLGQRAEASVTVTVTETPPPPTTGADLAITLTDSDDPVRQFNLFTYSITVTNNGPSTATGVFVKATLRFDYESAITSQGRCSAVPDNDFRSVSFNCDLGALTRGASATVTVDGSSISLGTIRNIATITANEGDPNLSNNTATQDTTVLPL
jgi:hypothetical protein